MFMPYVYGLILLYNTEVNVCGIIWYLSKVKAKMKGE
jgi:hypothetical protein